ncbi:MAG: glycosyltransferase family 4 protein [Pseudolysinimonas sp.]
MKVLVYADFRSSHARGWLEGIRSAGIDALAVSSEYVRDYEVVNPTDWVSTRRQGFLESEQTRPPRGVGRFLRWASTRQVSHTAMSVARLPARRRMLRAAIADYGPDVIQALRIPYEGLTILGMRTSIPRVVSTWGSDFEPMASTDPALTAWMRARFRRIDGFHTDSRTDLVRARKYGLAESVPVLYSAANFGVDESLFYYEPHRPSGVVVYPRKVKANANYRGFIEAAVALSASRSDLRFVAVGLKEIEAELVQTYGADRLANIRFTGQLTRSEMSEVMRSAQVVVTPTYWDGTPLTILEAIACGAAVVAGELPELRALHDDGLPIDLIQASSTQAIVNGIVAALSRDDAAAIAKTLPPQFDREANRTRAVEFYEKLLK